MGVLGATNALATKTSTLDPACAYVKMSVKILHCLFLFLSLCVHVACDSQKRKITEWYIHQDYVQHMWNCPAW